MKIRKPSSSEAKNEDAHDDSGTLKVYATWQHLRCDRFRMMAHEYLPGGKTFDWHEHMAAEEIMVVLSGNGEVHDEDGIHEYAPGDVFIFPANTKHKIHNPTKTEHEMIFVRIRT